MGKRWINASNYKLIEEVVEKVGLFMNRADSYKEHRILRRIIGLLADEVFYKNKHSADEFASLHRAFATCYRHVLPPYQELTLAAAEAFRRAYPEDEQQEMSGDNPSTTGEQSQDTPKESGNEPPSEQVVVPTPVVTEAPVETPQIVPLKQEKPADLTPLSPVAQPIPAITVPPLEEQPRLAVEDVQAVPPVVQEPSEKRDRNQFIKKIALGALAALAVAYTIYHGYNFTASLLGSINPAEPPIPDPQPAPVQSPEPLPDPSPAPIPPPVDIPSPDPIIESTPEYHSEQPSWTHQEPTHEPISEPTPEPASAPLPNPSASFTASSTDAVDEPTQTSIVTDSVHESTKTPPVAGYQFPVKNLLMPAALAAVATAVGYAVSRLMNRTDKQIDDQTHALFPDKRTGLQKASISLSTSSEDPSSSTPKENPIARSRTDTSPKTPSASSSSTSKKTKTGSTTSKSQESTSESDSEVDDFEDDTSAESDSDSTFSTEDIEKEMDQALTHEIRRLALLSPEEEDLLQTSGKRGGKTFGSPLPLTLFSPKGTNPGTPKKLNPQTPKKPVTTHNYWDTLTENDSHIDDTMNFDEDSVFHVLFPSIEHEDETKSEVDVGKNSPQAFRTPTKLPADSRRPRPQIKSGRLKKDVSLQLTPLTNKTKDGSVEIEEDAWVKLLQLHYESRDTRNTPAARQLIFSELCRTAMHFTVIREPSAEELDQIRKFIRYIKPLASKLADQIEQDFKKEPSEPAAAGQPVSAEPVQPHAPPPPPPGPPPPPPPGLPPPVLPPPNLPGDGVGNRTSQRGSVKLTEEQLRVQHLQRETQRLEREFEKRAKGWDACYCLPAEIVKKIAELRGEIEKNIARINALKIDNPDLKPSALEKEINAHEEEIKINETEKTIAGEQALKGMFKKYPTPELHAILNLCKDIFATSNKTIPDPDQPIDKNILNKYEEEGEEWRKLILRLPDRFYWAIRNRITNRGLSEKNPDYEAEPNVQPKEYVPPSQRKQITNPADQDGGGLIAQLRMGTTLRKPSQRVEKADDQQVSLFQGTAFHKKLELRRTRSEQLNTSGAADQTEVTVILRSTRNLKPMNIQELQEKIEGVQIEFVDVKKNGYAKEVKKIQLKHGAPGDRLDTLKKRDYLNHSERIELDELIQYEEADKKYYVLDMVQRGNKLSDENMELLRHLGIELGRELKEFVIRKIEEYWQNKSLELDDAAQKFWQKYTEVQTDGYLLELHKKLETPARPVKSPTPRIDMSKMPLGRTLMPPT